MGDGPGHSLSEGVMKVRVHIHGEGSSRRAGMTLVEVMVASMIFAIVIIGTGAYMAHGRAAVMAVFQNHIDLDSRIAAAIQDLAADNGGNSAH